MGSAGSSDGERSTSASPLPTPTAADGVLLSSDLLPLVLEALAVADCAAAAVCVLWRQAWAEKVRRVLRLAPPCLWRRLH